MSRQRLTGVVVASGAVIAAVVAIIALSVIPLPEFADLPAGTFDGSMAFVDEENCVHVVNLRAAAVTILRCEPERNRIEHLAWTDDGIEATTYLNRPITKVLDPATGDVLDTRTGDETTDPSPFDRPPDGLPVDKPHDGIVIVYDEEGNELLRLDAPEQYWIETALPSQDDLVAIADSAGRVAVFERSGAGPYLVTEDGRSWPPPVWAP